MYSLPYLDYAATTPLDPRVKAVLDDHLTLDGVFGNAASGHCYGQAGAKAVLIARKQVARLIGATADEIIFTSGATESNNLALKGVAHHYQSRGKHIISCQTEHKAILDPLTYLASQGFEITLLPVNAGGHIDLTDLETLIRPDTILCSFMHVNNETGVIHDIDSIAKITQTKGVRLHVDAAQSVGKLVIDLRTLPIDLLSIASHKLYGPKGIGALYVRNTTRLSPLLHGGGQERYRSGTLPTHQIAAFGKACELAPYYDINEIHKLKTLNDRLLKGLLAIEGVSLNASSVQRIPGILNCSVESIEGEALIMALQTDLAVSSGSACTTASIEPSHVLLAMGLKQDLAHASIRFSLGRFTTEKEIDFAITRSRFHIERLRSIAAGLF